MDRETFDEALRTFVRRVPFQPFMIELMSGSSIRVRHPEALAFNVGTGFHIDEVGAMTLFDHTTVAKLSGEVTATP